MNDAPLEGARCATHPESAASGTCSRCGNFVCRDCERRAAIDAVPVCPACWALSANVPRATSTTQTLQIVGLVLGIASVVPCCVLIPLGSLVFNVVVIVQSGQPPARAGRWKPILGLVLTLIGVAIQVGIMAFSMMAKG